MTGIRTRLTGTQKAQLRRCEHENLPLKDYEAVIKGTSKLEPLLLITVHPDKPPDSKPVGRYRDNMGAQKQKLIKFMQKQHLPIPSRDIRYNIGQQYTNQIGNLVKRGILTRVGEQKPYSYILTEKLNKEAA